MFKLVILIESSDDWQEAEERWPEFLSMAESMPGLLREATSHVESFLSGATSYIKMHELFFDSRHAAELALSSPQGRQAGMILQQITGGHVTLFLADHKEDNMANIRKYKPAKGKG
jgi:uncharacterized protein (TIGR02118 family)